LVYNNTYQKAVNSRETNGLHRKLSNGIRVDELDELWRVETITKSYESGNGGEEVLAQSSEKIEVNERYTTVS
jgi:hypothetical protein